jgi:hypothetical protein
MGVVEVKNLCLKYTMLIMTTVFSTILFFCLMQIKNKYKNKNSTKNTLLWTLLFGLLNYIIIFLSSLKINFHEGLDLSTNMLGPVYDEKTKIFNKTITVKGVEHTISFEIDNQKKIINIKIADDLISAMMITNGEPGIQGKPGIQGVTGIQGIAGIQGIPGPPGIIEITNKT